MAVMRAVSQNNMPENGMAVQDNPGFEANMSAMIAMAEKDGRADACNGRISFILRQSPDRRNDEK